MHPPRADGDWLDVAARLALRARPRSRPNPAVGALIVKDDMVVGRGWTQPGGRPHAEAMAVGQAGAAARGATAYVTLEPCAHRSARGPACVDLLIEAGIARVVAGIGDPDPRTSGRGSELLRAAGIETVALDHVGSRRSLAGYLTRAERGRPHVTLKLALTADGAIALPAERGRWITGDIARAHVHARRALADAILVGGGTWRSDAPRLDVRLAGLGDRSPERWVLTSQPVADARTIAEPLEIATMADIQYLYVEGGATTAAAFLAQDLVDRIELYRAPVTAGEGGGVLAQLGLGDIGQADIRWQKVERSQLGSDIFTAYERAVCSPA